MLTVTQSFLDECKGMQFHPLYDDDNGMLVDESRFNWWIDIGPGRRREAQWRNEERRPIPRATAEALIAATTAQSGAIVLPDGQLADVDEHLNLIPRGV